MFGRKNKSSKSSQTASKITRSIASATRSTASATRSTASVFETLESRQMYSGTPLPQIHPAQPLTVNLGSHSENVYVAQSGSSIAVSINGKTASFPNISTVTINAQSGNDTVVITGSVSDKVTVFADSGNDLLVSGTNNATLVGGTGHVNLIALGGRGNTLICGTGYDNVWMTPGNTATKGRGIEVLHAISGFINTRDMYLDGATFTEPNVDTQTRDTAGWANLNNYNFPLFSTQGPSMDDLHQGEAGTCYFLSSLGSVAMQNPQHICNLITSLGDGTYAEQFVNTTTGKTYFVRVDGYVPVSAAALQQGQLKAEYEDVGVQNCIWAPLMEKGWAYFRAAEQGKAASYGIAEGGTGQEGLLALGATGVLYSNNPAGAFTDGQSMLYWIDQQLQAGKAVDMGTATAIPGQLEEHHEYSCVQVVYNSDGSIAGMWVHNPWGVDTNAGIADYGHNDGYNDGYVFITPDVAYYVMSNLASGTV